MLRIEEAREMLEAVPGTLINCPSLSPEQRIAITTLVRRLETDPEFLGAILFGSTVEKKDGNPSGDIDFIGITEGLRWHTGVKKIGHHKFDIGLWRLDRLLISLLTGRDQFPTRDLGAGQLIVARGDIAKEVKAVAEYNWRKGPRQPKPAGYMLMRLMYQNLVEEMRASTEDRVRQAYLQAFCLHRVTSDFYSAFGLYIPKWTYLPSYLDERCPRMASLMNAALQEADLDSRQPLIEGMIECLLKPLGGFPPKEWVIVERVDRVRLRDPVDGHWDDWVPPPLETIQPLQDAYRIGLHGEYRAGGESAREYYYWNDPDFPGHTLPEAPVKSLVKRYARRGHVAGIVLFGSHALGRARPDSDIDLYIITDRRGRILERRFVEGVEFGIEFVDISDLYYGILTRSNTSFLRNFKEGKILFHRDPSIPLVMYVSRKLFQAGLPPLADHEITLEKARLLRVLQDGERLHEKGNQSVLSYVDNYLFVESIRRWFRMQSLIDSKRTYVMEDLRQRDPILHSAAVGFLVGSTSHSERHSMVRQMVEHILGQFGGPLPDEWFVGMSIDEF